MNISENPSLAKDATLPYASSVIAAANQTSTKYSEDEYSNYIE
jgi:hypothetical protein